MNFKNCILISGVVVLTVISMTSCNMAPAPGKAENDVPAARPDSLKNETKPSIVKDANGNMIERHDVTLGPNSEIRTRNEYLYTYDSQNNRTSEQIWRRSPDGTLVAHTTNTFTYRDGLLLESTFISYDAYERENNWLQNRYTYDNKRRETEVSLYNKKGNPMSTTRRIYNDKGNLWKEELIEYDDNGREKKRSGLEYSDRGAVVKQY